ncbi:hypothetical protein SAMN05660461_1714 [Chitinophaga ginsengisegetis]|uniref:Tetratricopeptide repeat-containing protein n=1 Tax=Chitinophaga ginsengisegetis TaxID=393003 RepID=A0A1T5NHS9_9BACT|nr:hypothetical protein [Chitinophaga ginsengisegetis]MDR6569684.1 hypothetical protein [Chitinophaga ginsengisegetis]MDR6649417.1 tetratricopeptide (TPR) repeat protein [Chitinophaga ginsengisegetis]MDR6655767.1 hypothetical protein [Chitinophaga ginsengisegetis]SKD00140.1 hypothetical protein SAMN05660461_1714 [Chitinophaga ginsengisegetis]
MPNSQTDALFILIKTLTKAEKRNFQLAFNKNNTKEDVLFIQLFTTLDKMKEYDEEQILKKITDIKKQQLSNVKAHLYKHLLSSLRQLYKQKDPLIDLREQLDHARVLYNKGLYNQSLKILAKAKTMALEQEEVMLTYEIVEFEKLIESRHITRSLENRAEVLSAESRQIEQQLTNISRLSTLSLRMYGLYLKLGHARNERDAEMVKSFFESQLPSLQHAHMSFYEKVYMYQASSWYYYILQDFVMYYRYTQKWVDLFRKYPSLQQTDMDLYIKAQHNLLTAHFYTSNFEKFKTALQDLEEFIRDNQDNFHENTRTSAFVYLYTAKINRYFLEGTFSQGLAMVPELETEISRHTLKIDQHRVLVFYYKIACLYFGSGDNSKAIVYLNKIINLKIGNLRADIQCFARILHLIAHYELENYSLVEYLIKSVYHFISKHKDLGLVMEEIMKFLRRYIYANPKALRNAFVDLKDRLEQISEDPYERRSFLYLDIISWLESKIESIPVQEVIHRKFVNKEKRI